MGGELRPLLLPRPELATTGPTIDLSVPRREWLISPDRLVRRLWLADIEARLPSGTRAVHIGARPAVRSVAALERRVADTNASSSNAPVVVLLEDGAALLQDETPALWGLRAKLSEQPGLHLFATSASTPTALVEYDEPFLEFFTLRSPRQVASQLEPVFDPLGPEARIAHHLLGGGTSARLHIARALRLAPHTAPDLLLVALDLMAPGLEAQVEGLSAQSQDVFAAVGSCPVAQTGARVAATLGVSPRVTSGQLRRLVEAGVLEDLPLLDEVTGDERRRVAFRVRQPDLALWALAQTPARRRIVRGWAALAATGLHAAGKSEVGDLASVHPESLSGEARASAAAVVVAAAARWSEPWRRRPDPIAAWAPVLALGWGTVDTRSSPWAVPLRRAAEMLADSARIHGGSPTFPRR